MQLPVRERNEDVECEIGEWKQWDASKGCCEAIGTPAIDSLEVYL